MSKKNPKHTFESVVEAYFHFTINEEGMNMQKAIRLACDATKRTYNSSMYTRWTQKSPQQDVIKFMQHYVARAVIKEQIPDITEKALKALVNNLSVPVTEEQNSNIHQHFSKAA
jgi:hypothetical protein